LWWEGGEENEFTEREIGEAIEIVGRESETS